MGDMTQDREKRLHKEVAMLLLPHITAINEILKDSGFEKYVDIWFGEKDFIKVDGSGLSGWSYTLDGDHYFIRHEVRETLVGGDE